MIIKEQVKYNCVFSANVYENDVLINTIEEHNLLLDSGKVLMLESMFSSSPIYGNIGSMVFGDSEVTPTVSDNVTDFGNYYINNTTEYYVDPTTLEAKVYWQIGEAEFNGNTIKTIGLVGSNRIYNYVFNRINLDSGDWIVKMPHIKATGYWQITLV